MSNGILVQDPIALRAELIEKICKFFNLDSLLFLDFETYYRLKPGKNHLGVAEKSYTLGNMTYAQYILEDDRFHCTGLGYAFDMDDWTFIHGEQAYADWASELHERRANGERIGLVAHNTQFDGSICNWIYGLGFDYYFCTQMMAKCRSVHDSSSLKNQAILLFPDDETMRKGTELANYDGVHYDQIAAHDLDPANKDTLASYCVQDNHLLREIFFKQMERGFPENELALMHITLRGAIEPQFVINREPLEEVVADVEAAKAKTVTEAIKWCHEQGVLEVSPATFSSNDKYKALLERFGITVPLKLSKTTFLMTPALGKNDPDYIKLQLAQPQLAPLYAAREITKSTIAVSRANKMIKVADLFHDQHPLGQAADMPMFLKYYGAENTGRWSGGEKLNQQNLQRNSKHRLALMAQEGHQIGVNDLSNIELRVNLWFCEQRDLIQKFAGDPDFDMYSDLASDIYGFPVNKKEHKDERQVGKAGSLGLGYAMSWFGFQQYLAGGPLGMEPMFVSDQFAKGVKNSYDLKHYAIVGMWNEIQQHVLPALAGMAEPYRFGVNRCVTAVPGKLILPSGRELHYPNCRQEGQETQWGIRLNYVCDSSRKNRWGKPLPRSLHKGLIIENIIQAIARDVLAWQMANIDRSLVDQNLGWVIGSVHDEVLAMLANDTVEQGFGVMQEWMQKAPDWAQGIPLASEGGYAPEYSK